MTAATLNPDLGHARNPVYRHPAHRYPARPVIVDRRQEPTNPALLKPGPRDGAFLADHQDPRPCATNPAQWWDTGDDDNVEAINLCNTKCPLKLREGCKPRDGERVLGVIRAGVAYNDRGTALKQCRLCDRPMAEWFGNSAPRCGHCARNRSSDPATYHYDIAKLIASKRSWSYIGHQLGIHPDTARSYWTAHVAKRRAQAEGRHLERLPGVTDATRAKPADHHDLVIRMLTDTDNAYTAEEVAWVIGSTLDAVKSYWRRERNRRIAAGEDIPTRRYVSNICRNERRLEDVAA